MRQRSNLNIVSKICTLAEVYIITTKIYLQDNDGNEQIPYFLYYASQGIIGYHIDSNLTYTLQ